MKQTQKPTRLCGPCRACCKPWTVPEVGKLDANWCEHSCASAGCKIYDQRPPACSQYTCLWLASDQIPQEHRPDLLGVILDGEELNMLNRKVGVLHFWEMEVGALKRPFVQEMIADNMAAGLVVILHAPVNDQQFSRTIGMSSQHFSPVDKEDFRTLYLL